MTTRNERIAAQYVRIAKRPETTHKQLARGSRNIGPQIALSFRSSDKYAHAMKNLEFAEFASVFMFVMISTYRFNKRSIPFTAYAPKLNQLTGQIMYAAIGNVLAFDAAVASDEPLALYPMTNQTAANMAVLMNNALEQAVKCDRLIVSRKPTMPDFYFVGSQRRPLRFEDSPALRNAATDLYPGKALTHSVLLDTWNHYAVRIKGQLGYPQEFFVRDTMPNHYDVCPLTGTPRPAVTDRIPQNGEQSGNWVWHNSFWLPRAQLPESVYADFRPVMGRERMNPAFMAFLDCGCKLLNPEMHFQDLDDETAAKLTSYVNSLQDAWQLLHDVGYYAGMALKDITDEIVAAESLRLAADATAMATLQSQLAEVFPEHSFEDFECTLRDPRVLPKPLQQLQSAMLNRLGFTSTSTTPEDVLAALAAPLDSLCVKYEGKIQVIELAGPVSAEALTWDDGYVHVNAYDLREDLQRRFVGHGHSSGILVQ